MKINWTNLHYFIIAAIALNFIFLYALSSSQLSKESKAAQMESESIQPQDKNASPLSLQLLKANDTQPIHSIDSSSHSKQFNVTSTSANSSVAEDIGKSMSSGSKPYPFPVTGAIKQLIGVTKEEAEAFMGKDKEISSNQKVKYLIAILTLCVLSLFIIKAIKKKEEGNTVIENHSNDKYILLDAEAD